MSYDYSLGQIRGLADLLCHVADNVNDDWCESPTDKMPWTDAQIEHMQKCDKRLHAMLSEVYSLLSDGHKLLSVQEKTTPTPVASA